MKVDDLAHEVRMLQDLTNALSFRTEEQLSAVPLGVVRDALTESYALHLRNLIEFLTKSPENLGRFGRSTVLSIDFLKAGVALPAFSADDLKVLRDAYVQACKEVSHLTWDRVENPQGGSGWFSKPGKIVLAKLAEFDKANRDPPEKKGASDPAIAARPKSGALAVPADLVESPTMTAGEPHEPMISGFSENDRRRIGRWKV